MVRVRTSTTWALVLPIMTACAASWMVSVSDIREWSCRSSVSAASSFGRPRESFWNWFFAIRKPPPFPHIRSRLMTNRLSNLGIFTALALSLSTPAIAADAVKVNELVIPAPIPDAQRDPTIHAARAFYDFWNNGDDALLNQAIAPTFTDGTLP